MNCNPRMSSTLKARTPLMLILSALFVLCSLPSHGASRLKYNELQIKDYEEMQEMVELHIRKSQKKAIAQQELGNSEAGDREAIDELTKALQLVFSRPDKDNMIAKLTPSIRKELQNYNAYHDTLSNIVTNCLSSLKMKKLPAVYRATCIFVLDNLMSEIRPELASDKELRRIVKKIQDADIDVAKDVRNHRKLTGMYETSSPSKTAKAVLKKLKKKKK